jgi:hypothetical protein
MIKVGSAHLEHMKMYVNLQLQLHNFATLDIQSVAYLRLGWGVDEFDRPSWDCYGGVGLGINK